MGKERCTEEEAGGGFLPPKRRIFYCCDLHSGAQAAGTELGLFRTDKHHLRPRSRAGCDACSQEPVVPLKSAPGWVMLGWWMPCWGEQHQGTEGMELRAPCPWECCHWYGGTGPCWTLAVPSALVSQGMLRLSWKALVKVPQKK